MNPEIPRSTRPTAAQIDCLMEFLEANRDLAKGFSKNPNARARSNLKWQQLASKLNSMGGSLKNRKQWMKYWADKKSAVKNKAAARNAARRRTGGGCEEVEELTEVEERIVSIMGGDSFATGDSHLRIEFIDPSQPSQPTQDESPSVLQEGYAQAPEPSVSALRSIILSPENDNETNQLQLQIIDTEDVDIDLGHRHQSQCLPVAQPTRAETPPPASPPHSPEPTTRAQSRSRARNAAVTMPRRLRRARVLQASPPSQRRSQLMSITEKFLRLEERRLELDRLMVGLMEQASERECFIAQANIALGEGLKALAEAISNNRL